MHKYIVTFSVSVLISSCTGSFGVNPYSVTTSNTSQPILSVDDMVMTTSSNTTVVNSTSREYTQTDFARIDHNLLELMKHHGYRPSVREGSTYTPSTTYTPSVVRSVPVVAATPIAVAPTAPRSVTATRPVVIPRTAGTPTSAYLTADDIARIENRRGNLRPATTVTTASNVSVQAPRPIAAATQCLKSPVTANNNGMYIPSGTEGRVLRNGGQIGFLVNGATYDLTGKSPIFGSC